MSRTDFDPAINPYSRSGLDADRHEIWDILMRRDFEAFVAGDWSLVASDFWEEGFSGVDARKEAEPCRWHLAFPSLTVYHDEWLRQVREFAPVQLAGTTILSFLYASCRLEDIEVVDNRAIARKKFDGVANTVEGKEILLRFQTLYQLARRKERWLITGFVGYLPNPMPVAASDALASTPW